LGILILAVMIVGSLQYYLYEKERNWLVDQNLEKIASTLIASGFSIRFIDNLDSANEILSAALKSDGFYHSINIFALDGELLYQNEIAQQLHIPFLPHKGWTTIKSGSHGVRLLQLQTDDLIIQIGIVLDTYAQRLKIGYRWVLLFLGLSFVILLVLSYYATTTLLKPLRSLARELNLAAEQVSLRQSQGLGKVETGRIWRRIVERSKGRNDEFGSLLRGLTHFFESLKNYAAIVDHNNAVLSHELKTPLTIILNNLEQAKKTTVPKPFVEDAIEETHRLTELINSYLKWSSLKARTDMSAELYVIRVDQEVTKAIEKLAEAERVRVAPDLLSSFKIAVNPLHFEQLINNLLSNALKYTKGKIYVQIQGKRLSVRDEGSGIPDTIIEKLGQPFNAGSQGGTGMGLAWVKELCDHYHWKLEVRNEASGCDVSVEFPDDED
jgi:signal transduction histidine kinase